MNKAAQRIITILLKDFNTHTVTDLSKELKMSRQGIWKILKELEKNEFIILEQVGAGKTSTQRIKLNMSNEIVEKTLVLCLIQDALKYKRWKFDFADLQEGIYFLILYGSILYTKEANDIDIIGVVSKEKKLANLDEIILGIQETQTKKIHCINLTQKEFKEELKKPNKAYVDALRKGVILFGQENFIKFIKGLQKWQ